MNAKLDDMRDQIAGAISRYDWEHGVSANGEIGPHQRGEADAVWEVVGPELRRLESLLAESDQAASGAIFEAGDLRVEVKRLRAELDKANE